MAAAVAAAVATTRASHAAAAAAAGAPEPATPPTGPPRCPVCGTLRLPGEATCLDGGVCTRAFDDTVSDTDVNEEGPVSPVHPQQPLGEPGPSEA